MFILTASAWKEGEMGLVIIPSIRKRMAYDLPEQSQIVFIKNEKWPKYSNGKYAVAMIGEVIVDKCLRPNNLLINIVTLSEKTYNTNSEHSSVNLYALIFYFPNIKYITNPSVDNFSIIHASFTNESLVFFSSESIKKNLEAAFHLEDHGKYDVIYLHQILKSRISFSGAISIQPTGHSEEPDWDGVICFYGSKHTDNIEPDLIRYFKEYSNKSMINKIGKYNRIYFNDIKIEFRTIEFLTQNTPRGTSWPYNVTILFLQGTDNKSLKVLGISSMKLSDTILSIFSLSDQIQGKKDIIKRTDYVNTIFSFGIDKRPNLLILPYDKDVPSTPEDIDCTGVANLPQVLSVLKLLELIRTMLYAFYDENLYPEIRKKARNKSYKSPILRLVLLEIITRAIKWDNKNSFYLCSVDLHDNWNTMLLKSIERINNALDIYNRFLEDYKRSIILEIKEKLFVVSSYGIKFIDGNSTTTKRLLKEMKDIFSEYIATDDIEICVGRKKKLHVYHDFSSFTNDRSTKFANSPIAEVIRIPAGKDDMVSIFLCADKGLSQNTTIEMFRISFVPKLLYAYFESHNVISNVFKYGFIFSFIFHKYINNTENSTDEQVIEHELSEGVEYIEVLYRSDLEPIRVRSTSNITRIKCIMSLEDNDSLHGLMDILEYSQEVDTFMIRGKVYIGLKQIAKEDKIECGGILYVLAR